MGDPLPPGTDNIIALSHPSGACADKANHSSCWRKGVDATLVREREQRSGQGRRTNCEANAPTHDLDSEAVGVHGARVALPLWQNRDKHALRHHTRRRTSPLGRAWQEAQNMGFYVMCVETPHLAHANDVRVVVRCYQAACEATNHGVDMPAAHHDGIISNHR